MRIRRGKKELLWPSVLSANDLIEFLDELRDLGKF